MKEAFLFLHDYGESDRMTGWLDNCNFYEQRWENCNENDIFDNFVSVWLYRLQQLCSVRARNVRGVRALSPPPLRPQ